MDPICKYTLYSIYVIILVSYAEDPVTYFAERVHSIKGSDDSILRFLVAHSEVNNC